MEESNPRSQILSIIYDTGKWLEETARTTDSTVQKVQKISSILVETPRLYRDLEVQDALVEILILTERDADPNIVKLGRDLIFKGTKSREGKLLISERALKKLNENITPSDFWDNIQQNGITNLEISLQDGKSLNYNSEVLRQFCEMKPSLHDLTEYFTIKFGNGDDIIETKAKLALCGEALKAMLNSNMKENREGCATFSNLTTKGFQELLKAVETFEYDFNDYSEEFVKTADYLQFSKSIQIPDAFMGQAAWEEHYGYPGEVPLPPIELIKKWNGPCPFLENQKFSDTHVVCYIPPTIDEENLTLNLLTELAKNPKPGVNKTKCHIFRRILPEMGNQVVRGGYWVAMLREPLENTCFRTYNEQCAYVADNCPGYEIPSTVEAMVCALMHFVCSGERKECILGRRSSEARWFITRCNDKVGGEQTCVGGFCPNELPVDCGNHANRNIGIAPIWKCTSV